VAAVEAERSSALALIEQMRVERAAREAALTDREQELAELEAKRQQALALIAELQAERDRLQADRAASDARLTDRERELAQIESDREAALALIARLEADKEALAEVKAVLEAERDRLGASNLSLEEQRREVDALRAAALAQLQEAQTKLTAEQEARLLEAQAAESLRQRLTDLEAKLTAEEEARLVEAAAAEALKRKLAESETELDAMTLALEKARKEAEQTLTLLAAAEAAKKAMQDQLSDGGSAIDRELALRQLAEAELAKAKEQTLEEQKRVALLNAQVKELREQLGGLQALLEDSEQRDAEAQVQIARLGERLNAALAQKVGELARFRSVFFEKMDQVLGGRRDIQRVGDRFVFQSEVLFAPGSADLGSAGQAELAKLGAVLREITGEMPSDLAWVLRVDGHTDKIPVGGSRRYKDNWELSQARALSVVKYLVENEKVPPTRLVAAGFGEFQPVDTGDTPEALAKNRRIEFKFTER
jgi:chemotaxis protein MotB